MGLGACALLALAVTLQQRSEVSISDQVSCRTCSISFEKLSRPGSSADSLSLDARYDYMVVRFPSGVVVATEQSRRGIPLLVYDSAGRLEAATA
jgi:hypothetical protein